MGHCVAKGGEAHKSPTCRNLQSFPFCAVAYEVAETTQQNHFFMRGKTAWDQRTHILDINVRVSDSRLR
jgi:hypothetical protein